MTSVDDRTCDPRLTSWVDSANRPSTGFPVQNLPFGVFRPQGSDAPGRIGVAIGDMVLDLSAGVHGGLLAGLPGEVAEACCGTTLNGLMALPSTPRRSLRVRISELLSAGSLQRDRARPLLIPMTEVDLLLPAAIGDYTDFYASIHHATHVGSMFRPDQPLLPNYRYVPIGYHGRSSSIVVSGTPVHRPSGQTKADDLERPVFGPCRQLDYELEVACFVGPGNAPGSPIPMGEAEEHLFGVGLLNDWSARDIQKWEYVPLGPFLAKNFATSISPWVVTMEALAPFRVPAMPRPASDPPPLPYLFSRGDQAAGGIDLILEVFLSTSSMRVEGRDPYRVSRVNFRDMYWTFAQMLTHHTGNGCPMRPGDLLGSGTVSGPERETQGCLLEVTRRGKTPLVLPGGEIRTFLEEGDEVTFRGSCERQGARWIGLGECRGRVCQP
jgi:fumarylacetoacetase